jgi:type I restriction enzyme M protein
MTRERFVASSYRQTEAADAGRPELRDSVKRTFQRQAGRARLLSAGLTLVCPIRGVLKAKSRTKDGLRPTEERIRVDAIRHLLRLGYPPSHFAIEVVTKKFGESGRNRVRADLVVLDCPLDHLSHNNVDELMKHALVLVEVKREASDPDAAIGYQVSPLLDFARTRNCVAVYWDDVQQRVFWNVWTADRRDVAEGSLATLPRFGAMPGAAPLTFATIDGSKSLLGIFSRIEDLLHSSALGPSKRFTIMLQLLLAKLFDEHQHESIPTDPLELQDYASLRTPPATALTSFNQLLSKASRFYEPFLPEPLPASIDIDGSTLLQVTRILAPTKIISMRRSVIQDFYMYFARHIYKWDLAQYFTPTPLTEFIIEALNPRPTEHIKDPACGSADFLTAAFRRGQDWPHYAENVWGADVSAEAVQVAVLNMILNGDGRTKIVREDSLANIEKHENRYDVVVCNPPFGSRITERRPEVLTKYELGRQWQYSGERAEAPTARIVDSQETGLLFAEACVRMLRPGGRMALIVPNGYLGNRSGRYHVFREWILRNCQVSAIVALPRFTFKGSGADVSASVLFCIKRGTPLRTSADDSSYEFAVEIIDRVGWSTGDKKALPTYKRDSLDGTFLLDEENNFVLDSEFSTTLDRLRTSDAAAHNAWFNEGLSIDSGSSPGWSVGISSIVNDPHVTLDPKRLSEKFSQIRARIMESPHFRLGDVMQFLPERFSYEGKPQKIQASNMYRYVEIQDVETAGYGWRSLRGWELPQRARHFAEAGDFYIGSIRNSVKKWFMVGDNAENLVVTNGMHRMRLKAGKEASLIDIVVGLSSEAYRVQMRGLARGADGLAEIAVEDAMNIVLPTIEDDFARASLKPFVDQLQAGRTRIEAILEILAESGHLNIPEPPPQPDHTALL